MSTSDSGMNIPTTSKGNSRENKNLVFQDKSSKYNSEQRECPSSNKGHRVRYTHKTNTSDSPSTYDSLRLTSPLIDEKRIKRGDLYQETSVGGDVTSRRLILKVDSKGNIGRDLVDHCTTVGITHSRTSDKTIVDISSANTYLHGNPLEMLRADEVPQFQEKLCTDLSEYLDMDVKGMDLSRVDSSTAFSMENPATEYIKLLSNCIPSKVRRRQKKVTNNETISFATQRREGMVMFYDKMAKEREKLEKSIKDEYQAKKNLLRFEVQMNKKRVVQKQIGQAKFRDLHTEEVVSAMVHMRADQFKKYFKVDQKLSKEYSMSLATAKALKSENKRNIAYILMGIEGIRLGVNIEEVISIMENAGMHRTTLNRARAKLQDLVMTDQKVSDLYDELTSKFQEELRLVA